MDKYIFVHLHKTRIQPFGLSLLPQGKRGKSGQRRALHFLTESCLQRQSNAEENNRLYRGKGEKVRQELTSRTAMYGLCILEAASSCKPALEGRSPEPEGRTL